MSNSKLCRFQKENVILKVDMLVEITLELF
jgi:hypothetical protein